MIEDAMSLHDLYTDPGHALLSHLLSRHPGAGDLIKGAQFEDRRDQIPDTAYAWPARALFPVHSPAHAVVSYLYAKHGAEQTKVAAAGRTVPLVPSQVIAEIEEALDAYGVDRSKLAAVEEKVAELREEDCLFSETKAYPVRNAGEIKIAEARLLEQVRKLRPETRVEAFGKLAAAAEVHGVELQPQSYRWAGRASTDPDTLAAALEVRASLTSDPEAKESFGKLAAAVLEDRRSLRHHATRVKIASAINDLDARAGLAKHYDRRIPDPVASVFNAEKIAEGAVDLGGAFVQPMHLERLPNSFYSDALGSDVLREIAPGGRLDVQKVAEVVNTLPADMKADFARQLRAAGIPVSRG
jgi:hypothetical protein